MKFVKTFVLLASQFALFAAASAVQTATFTQADLEKMVAQLDKVIPHNPKLTYPIKCIVLKDDDANAGAYVQQEGTKLQAMMEVNTGLLKAAGGEVRLVRACVSHELTHLSMGHVIVPSLAGKDVDNLWTRQQEFEADKGGAAALVKLGYAKKDMIDLLLMLDGLRGRQGIWLRRLTGDHADPKARAAEIADDPSTYHALVLFDTGLAYEDARSHLYAQKLFEAAQKEWPKLTVASINAAKCALMFYYDSLPVAVRAEWWRPDFGPIIAETGLGAPQGRKIGDEDRDRWKDAFAAAQKAVSQNPRSDAAAETLALAQVLEPDAKKEVVGLGVAWFKTKGGSESDPVVKLRYANNAGVGLQRTDDLSGAYYSIINAQKGITIFNPALGENMGLVTVKGRSKEDDVLAANVIYTWLSSTPSTSPRWATVKKTFDDISTLRGISMKIDPQPAYLSRVTTIVTDNKELGILLPVAGYESLLGAHQKRLIFNKDWPDFSETQWNDGKFRVWTERGLVMRMTSYQTGDYLLLKPQDATLEESYKIQVGMTKKELFAMVNEKSAVTKPLANSGDVEDWSYFPSLGMGVLLDGDTVKAITVSPIRAEPKPS